MGTKTYTEYKDFESIALCYKHTNLNAWNCISSDINSLVHIIISNEHFNSTYIVVRQFYRNSQ